MKTQVIIASAVVLSSFAFGAVDGMAQQIFNQFRQPELVVGRPYRDLDNCAASRIAKTNLPPAQFILPPTNITDLDDGYQYIPFPADFRFRYNDVVQTGIYVSINGFATFDNRKLVPAKNSIGLFINSASYPDNAVAPYWGDHRFRTNTDIVQGYMPSEISWAIDVDRDENCDPVNYTRVNPVTGQSETYTRRALIIQWKNLNVNDASVNSSVANFQARLYEATVAENYQGDIEFAYGQVGGNPNTSNTTVVTRGATVGIKGNSGFPGFLADFWNGLVWTPGIGANSRTDSTSVWQPSGGRSDAVIRFGSIRYLTFDIWGFGDADTSGAEGQRHAGLPQNRRVTSNDARVVIRSIVRNVPLDSVWKRQAYQADVNHSGRFYYTKLNWNFSADSMAAVVNPVPPNIVIWRRTIDVEQYRPLGRDTAWRSTWNGPNVGKQVLRVQNESEGLYGVGGKAPDVSSLNQIYYEATEYDAGLIMRYLSGRLPGLPWVYDIDTTGPDFGKVVAGEQATDVNFGTPQSIGNGKVRIPVYINGNISDVFGFKFSTNNIEGVTAAGNTAGHVDIDYSNSTAVVIGDGSFDASAPVAFVTLNESEMYNFSNIRFNETYRSDRVLNGTETAQASAVSVYPNPMTTQSTIAVNVPAAGKYTVRVFDTFGKLVATPFSGSVTANTLTASWNGLDQTGTAVAAGAYVLRVEGEGMTSTATVTVTR